MEGGFLQLCLAREPCSGQQVCLWPAAADAACAALQPSSELCQVVSAASSACLHLSTLPLTSVRGLAKHTWQKVRVWHVCVMALLVLAVQDKDCHATQCCAVGMALSQEMQTTSGKQDSVFDVWCCVLAA